MVVMVSKGALNMSGNSLRIIQLNLIYRIGKVILILGFYDNRLLEQWRVNRRMRMRPIEVIGRVWLHVAKKNILQYQKIIEGTIMEVNVALSNHAPK